MCGPVSLKVCTDGFFYTAPCPSGQSCNYLLAPPIPWDVVCSGCVDDSECNDGIYCNGVEACFGGACDAGSWPCSKGQLCDEESDQCVECLVNEDCPARYMCVEAICEPIPDDPPALGDGPFVAAGTWPLLSVITESPTYFEAESQLCCGPSAMILPRVQDDCTHTAEYQVLGDSTWTSLSVSSDAAEGTAQVVLPISSLQNATTYAFRFAVTDCAGQTTQSNTYYFRVAIIDAPPVITGGPWLAAGSWPVLATSESRARVLNQNEYVFWTFSDDYASCGGLCTHPARLPQGGRHGVDSACCEHGS